MNVIVLQVFVSLMLVAGAILLLAYSLRHADYDHADRLSLFPMEEDDAESPPDLSNPPEPLEEAAHVDRPRS